MRLRLETVTNVTIIVTGVLVSSLVLKTWTDSGRAQAMSQPYRAGDEIGRVQPVDFSRTARTVLLVVRSSCTFCSQSMPFYKRLAELRTKNGTSFHVVALTTEPIATGERYFSKNGISLDAVASYTDGEIRVRATPTLIVVDRHGRVIRSWVGLLSGIEEEEVIKSVL
jgi:thioredoxin-related protein